MMLGLLPPSSKVSRLSVWLASFMMICAVLYSPVKATLSTPGCLTIAAPAVGPKPGTTLITPSGMPAFCASRASRKQVSGVCSAGFITIVQPAANAGPHFQAVISMGKFQGMIWPTTPTGSRRV